MLPAKSAVQLKLRLHQVATQWEDVQNMIFQDDWTTGSSTRRPTKGHFLKENERSDRNHGGSQEGIHGRSIGEAQESFRSFFDTGGEEDAVGGLADGVWDRLLCELGVKVSQVIGATLRKQRERLLRSVVD